jgi:hypothetical protein
LLHRFWLKISNGYKTKSIYSHDTINVSLESEYDLKYKLEKNTGGTVADSNDSGLHTFSFTIFWFKTKKNQRTVSPREFTCMAQ